MLRGWRPNELSGLRCLRFFQLRKGSTESAKASDQRTKYRSSSLFVPLAALEDHRRLVLALHWFHQRHGHFCVPVDLVLPTTPFPDDDDLDSRHKSSERGEKKSIETRSKLAFWPKELHGLNFGEKFSALTAHLRSTRLRIDNPKRRMLQAIGFPVDNWREYEWKHATLPALEAFVKLHGHCLVPLNFVVPHEHKWPTESWGLALGKRVSAFRRSQTMLPPHQREILEQLGFVWDPRLVKWQTQVLPCLRLFLKRFGHLQVNLVRQFSIPSTPSWPREFWSFRLGSVFNNIRNRGDYLGIEGAKRELEQMGFEANTRGELWHQRVLMALETYKRIYGHCKPEIGFVVPSFPPWDPLTWGLRFERVADDIRRNPDFASQIKVFEKRWRMLDFDWAALVQQREGQFDSIVLPALQRFRSEFGHVQVPGDFIVPENDPTWPDGAWGFALGETIERIRLSKVELPKGISGRLMRLGLQFTTDFELRWHRLYRPALEVYASLHGSCTNLPESYVVPSHEPYPPTTWDLDIGLIMNVMVKPTSELYSYPNLMDQVSNLGFTLRRRARAGKETPFF